MVGKSYEGNYGGLAGLLVYLYQSDNQMSSSIMRWISEFFEHRDVWQSWISVSLGRYFFPLLSLVGKTAPGIRSKL